MCQLAQLNIEFFLKLTANISLTDAILGGKKCVTKEVSIVCG